MNPKITTFVFDAYGTIVHNPSKINIYKQLIGDIKTVSPMITNLPFDDFLLNCGLSDDEVDSYKEQMAEEINNIVIDQEAFDTIKQLKKAGYHIAVASNLANPYADPLIKFYSKIVDTWAFSFEIGAKKPQMSFYIDVMKKVNEKTREISYPDQFLMIGDNYQNDFVGPISCGMQATFLADANRKIDWSVLSKYY